jgi:YHS domain-containing protein
MFSAIVREFLLPLLVFLLLRSLLRSVFAALRPAARPAAQPRQTVQSGGVLKKDPVCGTYVSTNTAVTRTVDGELIYFCSKECAEKFPIPER